MAAAAASGVSVLTAGRAGANSGAQLPTWGLGDLQAGPLGINPANDPGQIPVVMRIPDAGVDAEVERQQIVDGQMLDPTGPWVVAWYEQTARAGAIGNCVAAGHVDYWDVGPSVFYDLSDIGEGSLIDVTGKDGTVYTYAVTNIRRVEIATLTVEELNGPDLVGYTDYPALTLITCGGTFDGSEYLERDIVRGELVSVQGVDAPATTADTPTDSGGEATSPGTGTVNNDGVNLRAEATTDGEVVEVLASGTVVTITGDPVDADGYTWLPVSLESGVTGWVVQDFITLP
jgi:sortase (surface protein transpeptidase)